MKTIDQTSIAHFKAYMSAKGRQPSTIESYGRDGETFLEFVTEAGLPLGDVSTQTLQDFQETLRQRGIQSNSVRRTIIGVRQFYRFLQDSLKWSSSPLDDAVIPERCDDYRPRLTQEDLTRLLQVPLLESQKLKAFRDHTMLHLLALEGLKVNELIELEWRDFLNSSGAGHLSIRGDRARTLTLEADTTLSMVRLRDIVRGLAAETLGKSHSKLMVGFKGSDAKHVESGLTRHGVKFALYELGHLAGIKQLNSEDLRHYAIAHKVNLGFTPEMLMNHLGLRTLGNIGRHFKTVEQVTK